MKNIIYVLVVILVCGIYLNTNKSIVVADEIDTDKGIKIDEKSFPDELLREHILFWNDENKDGYLSQMEIDAVTVCGVDAAESRDEEENTKYFLSLSKSEKYNRYGVIDCKGLEIFKNLKVLHIALGGLVPGEGKPKLLNFESLRFPKLERLSLVYGGFSMNYDFSVFQALKELEILEWSNIKKIKFGKKSKLEVIDLSDSICKKTIDVSNLNRLKKFRAYHSTVKKLTFGSRIKI